MNESEIQKTTEKKISHQKTFTVPFTLEEIQENINITKNNLSKLSEEKIMNQALKLHSRGNIIEAKKYYQYYINKGFKKALVFSNYSLILQEQGNLKEAELSVRKAIELKPEFANAHSNLGIILRDLGQLQEAELSLLKAIEIKPDLGMAYSVLSTLNLSNNNKLWKNHLFSEDILKSNLKKNTIDIYFARANILHKEKNYSESAKYLQLANKSKLELKSSKTNYFLQKSKLLLIESKKKEVYRNTENKYPLSIFIVGIFRSGSTLLESILSINPNIDDLGEINILEDSFLESRKFQQNNINLPLEDLYWKKILNLKKRSRITTNKNLHNYQYAGIIAQEMKNSKIIHCIRNPLDNILSIYRAHFARGHVYSSSLIDCAKIYLDQEDIMTEYKKQFRSIIYDLNYESLVRNPNQEIKSLISWLGWKWQESYLKPHLNRRSVTTASSIQVRYPINTKSIGGWKHYKDMLEPAIKILNKHYKYKNLTKSKN